MEIHAADNNARVRSEIDEITRRMIDTEQQLMAAQNANDEITFFRKSWPYCRQSGRRREEVLYFGR